MADLTTFNILTKNGRILPVEGAVGNPTITPRPTHNGAGTAFGLGANEVNGGMGGVYAFGVLDESTPADSFTIEADAYYADTPDPDSVVGKHDQVTLTTPRHTFVLIDFMEWWDSDTPGEAQSITVTGLINENIVTVSDIKRLTVGQGISSVGDSPIAAGTTIAGLYATPIIGDEPPVFTVRLSKALVAAATNSVAALSGANLRARIPVEEYQWHGSGLPSTIA